MTHDRTRIGDYQIEREIARGGYGIVYRAKNTMTGASYAIKVLHPERAAEASTLARFEREAAIVFDLAHPNLPQIHAWGHLPDGRPYILMELLEGESLDKRLARTHRLSVEETFEILKPIALALDAAHARGIIHRDIKPANVFLAPSRAAGNVVLLDFGIAKLVGADGPVLTTSRASLGTIPYMSPEQILGEPVDVRSDVYALAALTYAMLTGNPPFGTQPTAVLRQIHLHTQPQRLSERAPIPPYLDEPILRALNPQREQRPDSTHAFLTSLQAHVATPSAQPLPHGVFERPALAVHAEIRKKPGADDDDWLDALDQALGIVSREIRLAGLVLVQETSKRLLAISPIAPDDAFLRNVREACIRAYRQIVGMNHMRAIDLVICIHAGALHTNEDRTLLPSGLLDVASWIPPIPRGVVASRATFPKENAPDENAVASAPRFFWIERS